MTEKRFNCHVKFSAMPNGIMVLDYERNGDEQTVIEDISREKAHRVMDRLNELNDENEQLTQQLQIFEKFLEGNDLSIDWEEFCGLEECAFENPNFSCKTCTYLKGDVE